ncbi:MAG: hypothetical protein IKN57_05870 [Parasporobacterium sp.]|nr:hypothetical protein [Parasporobacterium sp.]MBR3361203.1 hypothetical protein [Lachnospiraceae bacterium]MBR3643019.1 hypothetical protein [Parasporobacterium sp.]
MLSMTARNEYRAAVTRLKKQGLETSEEMIAMLEHERARLQKLFAQATDSFESLMIDHQVLKEKYIKVRDEYNRLNKVMSEIVDAGNEGLKKMNEIITRYNQRSDKILAQEKEENKE